MGPRLRFGPTACIRQAVCRDSADSRVYLFLLNFRRVPVFWLKFIVAQSEAVTSFGDNLAREHGCLTVRQMLVKEPPGATGSQSGSRKKPPGVSGGAGMQSKTPPQVLVRISRDAIEVPSRC